MPVFKTCVLEQSCVVEVIVSLCKILLVFLPKSGWANYGSTASIQKSCVAFPCFVFFCMLLRTKLIFVLCNLLFMAMASV